MKTKSPSVSLSVTEPISVTMGKRPAFGMTSNSSCEKVVTVVVAEEADSQPENSNN